MKLTGNEILAMAEFVKENGKWCEYSIGNAIPEGSVGYKRYISTKDSDGKTYRKNVADYDNI